jgi:hypothetical protein
MREIKLRKGKTAPGLEDTKDHPSYKEGGLLFVLGQEVLELGDVSIAKRAMARLMGV